MKNILDWLKVAIGEQATAMLLAKFLTKENLRNVASGILDGAEKLALKTDTKIDDMVVAKLKEIAGLK